MSPRLSFSASLLLFLGLAPACTGEEEVIDPGPTPKPLDPPDVSDVDFPAAMAEAMGLALSVNARSAWLGHAESLGLAEQGCPSFYAGFADPEMADEGEGLSWYDLCTTSKGDGFGGSFYWESAVSVTEDGASGQTTQATRRVEGDAVVSQGDAVLFELDGEGEDSLLQLIDGDYRRVVYSSVMDATVTGTLPFPDGPAGGWRTDLNLSWTSGDQDTLAANGNVYFFDHLIAGRFDSVNMDLTLQGPTGASPEACTAEPIGFISLRDPDAFWYDLVFDPLESDGEYDNDPSAGCDGCGTLYIRGVKQEAPVCLDLSWVWSGALTPPAAADYALGLRGLGLEG